MRLILLAIIFCFSYSSDEREKREHIFENYIQKLDDKETNESLQQLVKKDFRIVTYKSTYILPATYSFNNFDDDRKKFETSFQISAQKPIFYNVFTDNDSINIAYTQKSFWQTTCNDDLKIIDLEKNSTIIFTSPSSVECFFKKFSWHSSFKAIVIGKTTALYLPEYIKDYQISSTTDVKECVKLALSNIA